LITNTSKTVVLCFHLYEIQSGSSDMGSAVVEADFPASRDFTPMPIGADISKAAFWL